MAKYFRPRRGTAANATAQNIVLKSGELFLEIPTGGTLGKSAGRIIVGDGDTAYSNISYASTATTTFKPFITDPSLYTPVFTNSTYATSSWSVSAATASIDKMGDGSGSVSLPTIISAVKEVLCKHEDSITKLNNDSGKLASSVSTLNTSVSNAVSTVTNLNATCSNLVTTCTNLASSVAAISTATGDGYNPFIYQSKRFRKKDLGCISTFTSGSTYSAYNWLKNHKVDTGKFEDIEVGDIVHICSNEDNYKINFIVVDLDFYFGGFVWDIYHSTEFTHHVVLIPQDYFDLRTSLGPNSGHKTGGYNTSDAKRFAEFLASTYTAKYSFSNTLGNYIIPIATHITNNMSTAIDSKAGLGLKGASISNFVTTCATILPSEVEIFGHSMYGSSPCEESFPYRQLAFFKYIGYDYGDLQLEYNFAQGKPIWTRTIGSNDNFVAMSIGDAGAGEHSNPYRKPYIPASSERCYMTPLMCLGIDQYSYM